MDLLKWLRPKPAAPKKRRYEAAHPSRVAGGFSLGGELDIMERLKGDLKGLIKHSRQQSENNDYIKAFHAMCKRHIVGPKNIRLQSRARKNGDWKADLDQLANAEIEYHWKEWCKRQHCSVDGRLDWQALTELGLTAAVRDGNVMYRKFQGSQFGKYGYQLQILEIDHLDFELNQTLNDGGKIVMGVQVDNLDRVVAYHMFRDHPGNYGPGSARERIVVPADKILHVFRPERPGQILGVPWSYTALRRLNMLNGYETAALTNARAGASKMGFIEPGEEDDGAIDPDDADEMETTESGAIVEDLEPGTVERLNPGEKFTGFDPAYPNGEIETFIKVMLRGAAAGLGVSYHGLANDLSGANFSTLRQGTNEERDEWRMLQGWLANQLHDPVAEDVLRMSILTGHINLPFAKLENFNVREWKGRGWQAVNPAQEASAHERNLKNKLTSPQDVVAESGQDLDEIYEKFEAASDMAKDHKLFLPFEKPAESGEKKKPKD